jgi:hypothetical protein
MTDVDLLLEMYKQQVARSEHYEKLRSSISSLVLAIAVALIGIATARQPMVLADTVVGIAIIALGVFGYFSSLFHSKRARRHGETAGEYREAIDKIMPTARIDEIHSGVRARYGRTHLNRLWNLLNLAIIAGGVLMLTLPYFARL